MYFIILKRKKKERVSISTSDESLQYMVSIKETASRHFSFVSV